MASSASIRTFRDAVAIVTGGASGIGKALTEELARRGCSVVAADVDFETPREAAAIPRDGLAATVPLDVRDAAAFHGSLKRPTHP